MLEIDEDSGEVSDFGDRLIGLTPISAGIYCKRCKHETGGFVYGLEIEKATGLVVGGNFQAVTGTDS